MHRPDQRETAAPAVGTPLDCGVGRPVEKATNGSGPAGTYGCACVSHSAHACAEILYGYREIPEPCECLCHVWRDDDE